MTEEQRTALNEVTSMEHDTPTVVGPQLKLRHISIEALTVLEMIGHPVATAMHAAMRGEQVPALELKVQDITELAWVLGDDPDVVLSVALSCTPSAKRPAVEAAVKFTRPFQDLQGWMEQVAGVAGLDAQKVAAAQFEAKSTVSPEKKMM